MVKVPFNIDPSATSVFNIRGDFDPVDMPDVSDQVQRAVVIGGGTGAPVSIRTLLSMGIETSAVVAMADDGGSTGILREKADVTPPGDIRKCITAFASDPFDPLVRAFKYRLNIADGHALGNLMLAALEDACGSFPDAIAICEAMVGAQGHVYPSTLEHITLSAITRDGAHLEGQAAACHSKTALLKVMLNAPEGRPVAYPPAIQAIEQADLIVLGPGSLFTSIIPNLLVEGIPEAIARSKGTTVFVCSLADVQGETWGLTALEHVKALLDHGMDGLLDYVLIHAGTPLQDAQAESGEIARFVDTSDASGACRPVRIDAHDVQEIQDMGPLVIARNLADAAHPAWHAPTALREALVHVMRLARTRKLG